jgi:hypothetical protein
MIWTRRICIGSTKPARTPCPQRTAKYDDAAFAASFIRKDTRADTSTPRTCGCLVDAPAVSCPTGAHHLVHWAYGGATWTRHCRGWEGGRAEVAPSAPVMPTLNGGDGGGAVPGRTPKVSAPLEPTAG